LYDNSYTVVHSQHSGVAAREMVLYELFIPDTDITDGKGASWAFPGRTE